MDKSMIYEWVSLFATSFAASFVLSLMIVLFGWQWAAVTAGVAICGATIGVAASVYLWAKEKAQPVVVVPA